MSFTGHETHDVPLATASVWTKNYRDSVPSNATIAHFFGADAIQSVLSQSGCVGIRIYYAINDNGEKQLVIVGANASEHDLYTGVVLDRSECCPSACSSANPLNTYTP